MPGQLGCVGLIVEEAAMNPHGFARKLMNGKRSNVSTVCCCLHERGGLIFAADATIVLDDK
jgi:hypothetical protein